MIPVILSHQMETQVNFHGANMEKRAVHEMGDKTPDNKALSFKETFYRLIASKFIIWNHIVYETNF